MSATLDERYHEKYGVKNPLLAPKTTRDLRSLYDVGMAQARRVLKPGGVLILKCQDMERDWNHVRFFAQAPLWDILDFFVVVQRGRPLIHADQRQHRARKNHSYFVILSRAKSYTWPDLSTGKMTRVVIDEATRDLIENPERTRQMIHELGRSLRLEGAKA